jgi:hypothetical protein
MFLKRPLGLFVLLFLIGTVIASAGQPKKRTVSLSLAVDGGQPAGWPIVVEVTVTNVGKEGISWWCGGPDKYPPARHFAVSVRYGAETNWHEVTASNGQYVEGSGFDRSLTPGESIQVPLAVPIDLPDSGDSLAKQDGRMGGVTIRLSPRTWGGPASETYVTVYDRQEHLDRRRARVISATVNSGDPFWRHLGERYPDAVVLDAMLKLVTVDCVPIAAGAARLLTRQPQLPEELGDEFALLVKRWVPRSPRPKWGGLRENIVAAALKTQSEPARNAVLGLLQDSPSDRTRWLLINALRLSPGDQHWLTVARDAIVDLGRASPDDEKLTQEVNRAAKWLDSRLRNEKSKPIANKAIDSDKK